MHQLARQIRVACILEATARKPGNVHPQARFQDLAYADFVRSADAAAPWLARAAELGVGRSVLHAVEATQAAVGRNTNLGLALLLAPLAAVPPESPLGKGIEPVLHALTVTDAVHVYRAIRCAAPAGLGRVAEQDVSREPTETLRGVMSRAAERDLIARQYACSFEDVLGFGLTTLREWWERCSSAPQVPPEWAPLPRWEGAVLGLSLSLLACWPDSLIERKCGRSTALEASAYASRVLQAGWPEHAAGWEALAAYDQWLRSDGHRRNPGTTADLVGAVLFAALRERHWRLEEWAVEERAPLENVSPNRHPHRV